MSIILPFLLLLYLWIEEKCGMEGNFMVNGFLKIQIGPIQFFLCVIPL